MFVEDYFSEAAKGDVRYTFFSCLVEIVIYCIMFV